MGTRIPASRGENETRCWSDADASSIRSRTPLRQTHWIPGYESRPQSSRFETPEPHPASPRVSESDDGYYSVGEWNEKRGSGMTTMTTTTTTLPEPAELRTSLLMPHMSTRFSILRDQRLSKLNLERDSVMEAKASHHISRLKFDRDITPPARASCRTSRLNLDIDRRSAARISQRTSWLDLGFSGQRISHLTEADEVLSQPDEVHGQPEYGRESWSHPPDKNDVKVAVRDGFEMETEKGDGHDDSTYPPFKTVLFIIAALDLVFFLIVLDGTIIATAIPQITDEFRSLLDVGWYGSAYMLPECAFQLLMGRLYTLYSPKVVFLSVIGCFEIGSVICGAATSSPMFIFGRAIAGLGSSGIFSGAVVLITHILPLHKRPALQGMIGAILGIGSVLGPLLGGIFTTRLSWRFCFYINIPVGLLAMLVLFWKLKIPKPVNRRNTFILQDSVPHRQHSIPQTAIRQSFSHQLLQLDPVGTLLFLTGITCLLLALQWGGIYGWGSGRVVASLIFAVLSVAGFLFFQDTVPTRLLKQRTIATAMITQFCIGGCMLSTVYYLPIWFQAIKHASAIHSGVMSLPLIISLVFASILGGLLISRIGYYTPSMIVGTIFIMIGAALMTTFQPDSKDAQWIGYQILVGIGQGLSMSQASLAAQTVLPKQDVPMGVALMQFSQQFGGAIFLSISETVFSNGLVSRLKAANIPGIDAKAALSAGATDLAKNFPANDLGEVIGAYNGGITSVFCVVAVLAAVGILASLGVEWRSVKRKAGDRR